MALDFLLHPTQRRGHEPVVRIEDTYQIAFRLRDSPGACGRDSLMLLEDDPQPAIALLCYLKPSAGLLLRAVVDHHHLVMGVILCECAADGLPEERQAVVGSHYDR